MNEMVERVVGVYRLAISAGVTAGRVAFVKID